jgi:MFS transporter, PAT family, beta-lactamase induction signal transducer AmpG
MLRAVVDTARPDVTTWQSLRAIGRSPRLAAVALLSFSSGLPLGLVWIAIPAWMARAGVDIKVVGLFTLAQAPWSFKFLWSPLMDRFPLPFLGRKRGFILVSQAALLILGLWLAAVSDQPEATWVIGSLALAIGLAAATQDIAYDGYAVEILEVEEQGLAVGARAALYRIAMFVSGGLGITLASTFDVSLFGHYFFTWHGSWAFVNAALSLFYVPCAWITWKAPEPPSQPAPRSLKDAVFGPFMGLLGQHRALEILAFVVLFKLSDNLTQALLRPFFVQMGFNDTDVGVATMTIGTVGLLVGTFLGGMLTNRVGLGRALWISGVLQIASNLGYAVVAEVGPNRPVMYSAQAFEFLTSGLGTGAFGVLLLRLTEKRFSATQYALLSSLLSIPRVLAGPPTGLIVDLIGWRDFFFLTVLAGIPGLLMLARFVPWRVRDPVFHARTEPRGAPVSPAGVAARALVTAVGTCFLGALVASAVSAIVSLRAGRGFNLARAALALARPHTLAEWTTSGGLALLAVGVGLGTAAAILSRRPLRGREVSGMTPPDEA